jgi:hypothetical protein
MAFRAGADDLRVILDVGQGSAALVDGGGTHHAYPDLGLA